jgi:hypothetical protein
MPEVSSMAGRPNRQDASTEIASIVRRLESRAAEGDEAGTVRYLQFMSSVVYGLSIWPEEYGGNRREFMPLIVRTCVPLLSRPDEGTRFWATAVLEFAQLAGEPADAEAKCVACEGLADLIAREERFPVLNRALAACERLQCDFPQIEFALWTLANGNRPAPSPALTRLVCRHAPSMPGALLEAGRRAHAEGVREKFLRGIVACAKERGWGRDIAVRWGLEWLQGEETADRRLGIWALGELVPDPEVVAALAIAAAEDPSEELRQMARRALGTASVDSGVPASGGR